MKHVLGIDAGGTKTVCLLADEQGRVLAEARGGGANLNTAGELGVEMVLHAVMEEAIGDREVHPAVICLGMAGVDRDDDYRTVRSIMRRIGYRAPVLIVNDALVALEAGAKDGPGIVVIAGTGSIAYGRDARNRAARAGGWGHVLGDEGSGYWIGRQALQAVMREADGRGPATALTARVLAHFGVEKPSELVRVVYYADVGRQAVAALGPLVESAYHEGDEVAVGILREAAAELVAAARSVTRQLEEAFPFILAGGIFRAVPWLASAVSTGLAALAARSTVRLLEAQPATGAVRLAIAELCGGAKLPHYV
jgi:N-acetylglucosamine kinase-like BadF-type ATPase